jgi:hypothetical protein
MNETQSENEGMQEDPDKEKQTPTTLIHHPYIVSLLQRQ